MTTTAATWAPNATSPNFGGPKRPKISITKKKRNFSDKSNPTSNKF